MKDSMVDWLGSIPAHWEVCALRRKLRGGDIGIKIGPFGSQIKLEYMQEDGYKVYGQENVITNDFTAGRRFISAEKYAELAGCSVRPGDILVTMMGSSGRCQVVPDGADPGIMDSHLLRLGVQEKSLLPRFLALLIDKSSYVKYQIGASGKGSIMHGLNSSIVKDLFLGIPSRDEQKLLLNFLDRKTALIDGLIAKRERQIELLQELRTALISRAVTKGLDPNVQTEDSGVEWLEEMPVHWKRMRFGFYADFIVPMRDKPEDLIGPIPWVRIEDFDGKYISGSKSGQGVSEVTIKAMNLKVFPKGTVLCSCSCNMGATAIAKNPLVSNQTFIGIVPGPRLLSEYVYYLMQVASEYLSSIATGAIQQYLSRNEFQCLRLPLPPLPEQNAIASFLDRETTKIDTFVAKVQQSIEELREYRQSLISAAVTGKIDVRNWQPSSEPAEETLHA